MARPGAAAAGDAGDGAAQPAAATAPDRLRVDGRAAFGGDATDPELPLVVEGAAVRSPGEDRSGCLERIERPVRRLVVVGQEQGLHGFGIDRRFGDDEWPSARDRGEE